MTLFSVLYENPHLQLLLGAQSEDCFPWEEEEEEEEEVWQLLLQFL
jgi:hypothetical protein